MHAVARIAYHGLIDNIQASWVKHGAIAFEFRVIEIVGHRAEVERFLLRRCSPASNPTVPSSASLPQHSAAQEVPAWIACTSSS